MRTRIPPVAAVLAVALGAPRTHAAVTGMAGFWDTEVSVAFFAGQISIIEALRRTGLLDRPPYNAEWERKSSPPETPDSLARRATPTYACRMRGFPAVMQNVTPDGVFQLVVTPGEILLLISGEVRQIFTDGRAHPDSRDLWPTPMGDSIGHWTGRTLHIDTIARKAGPVGYGGGELSDQAHFTEELRLIDASTLQDDMTIEDPTRLARPWRFSIRYKRATDIDRLIPYDCTENERFTIRDGKPAITPP